MLQDGTAGAVRLSLLLWGLPLLRRFGKGRKPSSVGRVGLAHSAEGEPRLPKVPAQIRTQRVMPADVRGEVQPMEQTFLQRFEVYFLLSVRKRGFSFFIFCKVFTS